MGAVISAWISFGSHRWSEFCRIKQDLAHRFLRFYSTHPGELLESKTLEEYGSVFSDWVRSEFTLARFYLSSLCQHRSAKSLQAIEDEVVGFIQNECHPSQARSRGSNRYHPESNSVLVAHARTMNHLKDQERYYIERIRRVSPSWIAIMFPTGLFQQRLQPHLSALWAEIRAALKTRKSDRVASASPESSTSAPPQS